MKMSFNEVLEQINKLEKQYKQDTYDENYRKKKKYIMKLAECLNNKPREKCEDCDEDYYCDACMELSINRTTFNSPIPLEFRSDKDIILAYVSRNYENSMYIDPALYYDEEFVLKLLAVCPYAYRHAPYPLKSNSKLALYAIGKDASVAQYVNQELFMDREFCLSAIYINEMTLKHVINEEILKTKVIFANIQNQHLIQCAHAELLDDKEFMLEFLNKFPLSFHYASERIRNDPEVIRKIIEIYPDAVLHSDVRLWKKFKPN